MDETVDSQTPVELPQVEESGSSFPVKKAVSLFVGLVVFIIIALIIFVVVAPRFFPKKAEDITLNYWVAWEDEAPFRQVAAEFNRLNPHVKVVVEKQDIKALGKYVERLSARLGNGTGPDVFRYHNSWVREILPLLSPLPQDVVASIGLSTSFYPVARDDLKVNGAYYGVPLQFDALCLFVNTDLEAEVNGYISSNFDS